MMSLEKLLFAKVMITQLFILIYYPYFKNYYELIATDISKQQKLDADPKEIQ